MMRKIFLIAGALTLLPLAAFAKVTITPAQAPAGGKFTVHFKVSDGCNGGVTSGLSIAMPKSVANVDPQFVTGWLVTELHSPAMGDTAAWRSGSLAAKGQADFPVAMVLPKNTGPLSFAVIQECSKGVEKSAAVLTLH